MKWVLKFGSYEKPDDIFDAVVSGKKTIETRPVNKEKKRNYSQIKSGDELVLVSLISARKLLKKVSFVRVYKTVREMAEKEEVGKIFPGAASAEELIAVFEEFKREWGKAYATKLEENGVVAIGME